MSPIKPKGKPAWSREASIEDLDGHVEKKSIMEARQERIRSLPVHVDPNHDQWATLERFFLTELNAFSFASRTEDRHAATQAACQSLFWACALDEWLATAKGRTYRGCHQRGRVTRTLDGIRYARNVASHRFYALFNATDGACMPLELPAVFFELRWVQVSDLPPTEKRTPDLLAAYEKELQGAPARLAFRVIEDLFKEFRSEHYGS